MKKSAFTLLELVIVIVVVGIIAVAMMPKLDTDPIRDAANQVVRHIQYTQHLAMVDDVYDATNANWQRAFWHISFRNNAKKCYIVASDIDTSNGISQSESAWDPATKQFLYSSAGCVDSPQNNSYLMLNSKYGITGVTLSSGCGDNGYIAFDNFGRPLQTKNVSDPVTSNSDCTITLTTPTHTAVIQVEAETGYTHILSIDD